MLQLLPLQHLDEMLIPWRGLPRTPPRRGWLRAIREALGMTTRQLAAAAHVTQNAVVTAERGEARGDITLSTLRQYAAALNCELVYALVPQRSLVDTVHARAEHVAREQVARVHHSMTLEDQATRQDFTERQVAELRRRLLEGKRSRLWQ